MKILIATGIIGGAMLLGSCATMSEDQCRAGAWGEQGYADGAAGLTMSQLDEHAEACAKYGVTPEVGPYSAARADGLRQYCTLPRGFQEGRAGNAYNGVCSPVQEADFLPAYRDGQVVHEAEAALSGARSQVDSLGSQLEDQDDKIRAKERDLRADGVTDAEKDAIRARIQEVRRERADTEREWRRAQNRVDDAEREARFVRLRFQSIYGGW